MTNVLLIKTLWSKPLSKSLWMSFWKEPTVFVSTNIANTQLITFPVWGTKHIVGQSCSIFHVRKRLLRHLLEKGIHWFWRKLCLCLRKDLHESTFSISRDKSSNGGTFIEQIVAEGVVACKQWLNEALANDFIASSFGEIFFNKVDHRWKEFPLIALKMVSLEKVK